MQVCLLVWKVCMCLIDGQIINFIRDLMKYTEHQCRLRVALLKDLRDKKYLDMCQSF